MAQHDYVIDNSTGANVRADINSVLQAISTNNSGSSAPSATFASQFFADTSAGQLKLRNTSNNGYVSLFTLAGGVNVDAASNFNEDVTFKGVTSGRNIVFDKSDNSLEFADNAKAKFGASSDLQIYHDGTSSFIDFASSDLFIRGTSGNQIRLQPRSGEDGIKIIQDGAVELYCDNSKKFETTSTGVTLSGTIHTITGDFYPTNDNSDRLGLSNRRWSQVQGYEFNIWEFAKFFDNIPAKFGDGDDLKIFHDASHSYVEDVGTGELRLASDSGIRITKGSTETCAFFDPDGKNELYFDNSVKLETTSTGITVTGTVTETSDIAMKSDLKPLTNTLEKIQQITGYKYNLINSISPSMGVIAQDVEKVFPELVHGSEGKKTLQYSGLIGVLVEAVKDLSAKVAALEAA